MTREYQEVPSNFAEIENYLSYEKEEVIDLFFAGDNYYFYDTCSLIHHSNSAARNYILQYLKDKEAIIIITRTVLMELSTNCSEIHPTQVNFIKELYDSGLKVLLFAEEFIVDCLKEILNITNEDANLLLGYAIKEVSKFKSTIYQIKNSMENTFRGKLLGNSPGSILLYEQFFQYARSQKNQGDSLAEKLIFICIIVLTKIPRGKYILVSDDLNIRAQVIGINEYLQDMHQLKAPLQLTTPALVYKMYKKSVITNRDDLLAILSAAFSGNIYVFYIGEYDIKIEYSSFTKEGLIDRLLNEEEFRIMF